METKVKGYKVFNADWTCRGKQYTCPGMFEENGTPVACQKGMHFCKKAVDCFRYYDFAPQNKVAEVIAHGEVAEDGDKCCTNKLEIVREIPWAEVFEMVNTGDYNTGNRNTGNCNTGNCNTGDCNTGDWNSANHATGCFCVAEQKIYMFDKRSPWEYKDWLNSAAYNIMERCPQNDVIYTTLSKMTDCEKVDHPEAETIGGYLKKVIVTDKDRQDWWDSLMENEKKKSCPCRILMQKYFARLPVLT